MSFFVILIGAKVRRGRGISPSSGNSTRADMRQLTDLTEQEKCIISLGEYGSHKYLDRSREYTVISQNSALFSANSIDILCGFGLLHQFMNNDIVHRAEERTVHTRYLSERPVIERREKSSF
jgi:hypothetical protein